MDLDKTDENNDRLKILEERVYQQNDEIKSLRITVDDLVQRIKQIEAVQPKYTNLNKELVQSKDPIKPPVPASSLPKTSNLLSKSFLLQKSASIDKMPIRLNKKPLTPAISTLDINFNSEQNFIKFFLRGRPITFYLPNSNNEAVLYNFEQKLKVPETKLKLEWAYGYRGKDCRSNLYYLANGETVYFIAAIVILQNINAGTQRFYNEHTDDVKSLAIHPNGVIVASGQTAGHDKLEGKAHVRIWDSTNLLTLRKIGISSDFQSSISCLSFSKLDDGQHLAVVDDGNEKWLSIWNWQNGQKPIATAKSYSDLVFVAEFSPVEKNLIVTCGKQHVTFWNFDGQILTKRMGHFESFNGAKVPFRIEKPKYVTCISFGFNGEIISGDSEGQIIFWSYRDCKITRLIKEAHEGSIFSILTVKNSSKITMITGGKSGCLIEWNHDYEKTGRNLQLPEVNGACRVIASYKDDNYLIGTTKNCLFEVNFETNRIKKVVNGHDGELWGLTGSYINQTNTYFTTCGYDRNLFYWNSSSHELIHSFQFEEPMHCINMHPKYEGLVAIGLTKPKWIVFDLNERKEVFSQNIGTEQIECISFSPNGLYLACGSRDNFIYVYTVSEDGKKYSKIGKCSGHSSFITHIDWSIDNQHLMSNSGDYEILTWNAQTCKQITQVQQLRDLSFITNTCVLSLNSVGIWNGSYDGTDINAAACSTSKKLLCYVDDHGKVNIVDYPCISKAEKNEYKGHSSHVTNVIFINNDSTVITTGGNDMAILQWKVINDS